MDINEIKEPPAASAERAVELLDIDAACALLGGTRPIDRSTLYRGIAAGIYPRPIKVGPQLSRWLRPELLAVIASRISERDRTEVV